MGFALRLSPWLRGMRAPSWIAPPRARRFGVEDGSVAVEFAFIGPLLILVLSGIFTYGGYFLTAHTVQQIANDAARAAIAGLDDDERQQIASTSAAQDIATQTFMRGDLKAVTVTRAGDMVTVGVSYDAREDVYWAFAALLPVPSPLIARSATIRVGGY